jgi:hypothetical protein
MPGAINLRLCPHALFMMRTIELAIGGFAQKVQNTTNRSWWIRSDAAYTTNHTRRCESQRPQSVDCSYPA